MCERGIIQYIPFPEDLKGKYQSHTQADMAALRSAREMQRHIDAEVTNACRCSTYHRIRQAIRLAATGNSAGGRTL